MNNFREWLSDNLRYILLILGIIVILVGAFFGIRALSGLYSKGTKSADISQDSIVSAAATPAPEAVNSTATSKAAVTPTATPTATPTPTATSTPTPTPTAEPTPVGGALQENAVPEITQLVTTYYAALQNRDPDMMRTVVDSLSEADAVDIADAAQTVYTDLIVYTKQGADADSYIIYANYKYQNDGDSTSYPGLSQLYAKKSADGSYKITMGDYDSATSAYIDSVNSSEDVKALTEKVQTEYASAQAASEEAAAKAESDAAAAAAASDAAAAEAAQAAATAETPATILSMCNVRSGPGYEYGVIFTDLPAGTAVAVIGDTGAGWLHIRTGSVDGYVGGHFVGF